MPDRIDKLFVYGALAPGRPNAHILANVPGAWQKAIVRGHPLQGGWGAQQGFPGILVDHTADPVEGYVFTSNALAAEWERLDRFEDTRYQRVTSRAVRQTEALVRQWLNSKEQPVEVVKADPDISRLEQRLAERLGAAVQIKHGQKGRGQLVIKYSSLDELQGVLAHIR